MPVAKTRRIGAGLVALVAATAGLAATTQAPAHAAGPLATPGLAAGEEQSPLGGPIVSVSCTIADGFGSCSALVNNSSSTLSPGKLETQIQNKLPAPVTVTFAVHKHTVAKVTVGAHKTITVGVACKTKGAYTLSTRSKGKTVSFVGGGFTIS